REVKEKISEHQQIKGEGSLDKKEAKKIVNEAGLEGRAVWNKEDFEFEFNFFGWRFKQENLAIVLGLFVILIISEVILFKKASKLNIAAKKRQEEDNKIIYERINNLEYIKAVSGEKYEEEKIMNKIVDALLTLDQLSSYLTIVCESVKSLSPGELRYLPTNPTFPFENGDIIFDKVVFAYPKRPQQDILRNFSFRFLKGKSYGIAGKNGIGKSTITKTTLKLYEIKTGQILIEFIEKLPNQFATELREGGTDLSEGQKQQIAAMRIFIRDYDIYILDEILSNVHPDLKEIILQNIFTKIKNKTTLVIDHHYEIFKYVDYVYQFTGENEAINFNLELKHPESEYQELYLLREFLKRVRQDLEINSNIELAPHTLRRCFATYNLLAGMPLNILQRVLGHSRVSTTALYIKDSDLANLLKFKPI
ncbi:23664_t:CDS:2, partial [Entrophospora sp. SA101]